MSFTDDQLLNLVNNTILTKSEFKLDDFTGGGVQITSTHNHKIIKHKIYLTFGYDEKRNSKSYSEDIEEDITSIWQSAILLKVKSMQVSKIGSSLSDLNKLMNTDIKIEIEDNKIIDRDKECNDIVPTSLRTPKEFTFSLKRDTHFSNLSKEYISNLEEYIRSCEKSLPFEEFRDGCLAKNSYKYKNFKLAYNKWNKNYEPPKRTASNIEASLNVNVFDAIEARAMLDQQAQQEQGVIDG